MIEELLQLIAKLETMVAFLSADKDGLKEDNARLGAENVALKDKIGKPGSVDISSQPYMNSGKV